MSSSIEHVHETLTGDAGRTDSAEETLYETLKNWGFTESTIERGRAGINVSARVKGYDDYEGHLEETFGSKHPFLAAMAVGEKYQPGRMSEDKTVKAVDTMVEEKAVVDATTVQDAVPVIVDPFVMNVQRQRAPVLDRIPVQSQQGYAAQYNVITDRSEPIAYAAENEVIDLSGMGYGDFTMQTDSEEMDIYVDQINISDFSQRAVNSLNYMDLESTTFGQRTIAWALTKAAAYFYADPSADETGFADGFGYESLGTDDAFPGLVKRASDAGNNIDKSTVDSTADGFPLLESLKSELTKVVEETGLTYADAEFFVSPSFFDTLENELHPHTRTETYDESVNFGGRQITIKGNVPVTECPNIMPNFDIPWDDGTLVDEGNVFLIDQRAIQFRALAPLFTLPLGRVGLADHAALAEYGTLIDRSQGHHTYHYEYAV